MCETRAEGCHAKLCNPDITNFVIPCIGVFLELLTSFHLTKKFFYFTGRDMILPVL